MHEEDEQGKVDEAQSAQPPEDAGKAQEPPAAAEETDSHGQPGINRQKYQRDVAKRDQRIRELEDQLAEAQGRGKTADEKVAELSKSLEDFKARLEDERLEAKLSAAGCVNAKAAKAVLGDYDGDVAKLVEACPYLFQQQTARTGSTGLRPGGAPDATDEKLDRAFGLKK